MMPGWFDIPLPAVVVTATADIAADKPVRVAAITTRLPKPLPEDHVLLPGIPKAKHTVA